jgi:hypothetical protein
MRVIIACRLSERDADKTNLRLKLRERIYTSNTSRYVNKEGTKEEAFININMLSR